MNSKEETGLLNSIDFIINQILEISKIDHPPIDTLLLADVMGILILFDETLAGRGRQKQISGKPTILIKPDDRPERVQWAVAHEIGEIIAHRIYESEPDLFEFSISTSREKIANLIACRLLVPDKWFSVDCLEVDFDLYELKNRYNTASYELIANRFPDQNHHIVVTLFDQGELIRRNTHPSMTSVMLSQSEREIWLESHQKNIPVRRKHSEVEASCWPIHEPGWKREILCTTYSKSYFEPDFPEIDVNQDYEVYYQ